MPLRAPRRATRQRSKLELRLADELGDRRSLARASGREESPDSGRGEFARAGHGTLRHEGFGLTPQGMRATRLVTPGGLVVSSRLRPSYGKCHRKLNRR